MADLTCQPAWADQVKLVSLNLVSALVRLRGFAHIEVGTPVIRCGKSGHVNDKALEGVAHHAVIPNVNVLDDLKPRLETAER
jgi:hypothetical protein